MLCIANLAQSFGRIQPATLCDELLEVAAEVQAGLPDFYWLGPYHTQRRRLSRAARCLRRELAHTSEPAELAEQALDLLLRVRRRLTAAHRALQACDWPAMQRQLRLFQARLAALGRLTDQLEEADAGFDLHS